MNLLELSLSQGVLFNEFKQQLKTWLECPIDIILSAHALKSIQDSLCSDGYMATIQVLEIALAALLPEHENRHAYAEQLVARAQSVWLAPDGWHVLAGLPVAMIIRPANMPGHTLEVFLRVSNPDKLKPAFEDCMGEGMVRRIYPYAVPANRLWVMSQADAQPGNRNYGSLADTLMDSINASVPSASDSHEDICVQHDDGPTTVALRMILAEVVVPEIGEPSAEAAQSCCHLFLEAKNIETHRLHEAVVQSFVGSVIPDTSYAQLLTCCGPVGDLIPMSVWNSNSMALFLLQKCADVGTVPGTLDVDEDQALPETDSATPADFVLHVEAKAGGAIVGRVDLYPMAGLSPGHLVGCMLDHFDQQDATALDPAVNSRPQ